MSTFPSKIDSMPYGEDSLVGTVRPISLLLCRLFTETPRLFTETPRSGGRIFETGDEDLLRLAHETQSGFFTTTSHAPKTRWNDIHGTSSRRDRFHKV